MSYLVLSERVVSGAAILPMDDTLLEERWMRPCRGSIAAEQSLLPDLIGIQTNDEAHLLHMIWIKAHEVIEAATVLRDRYVSYKLLHFDNKNAKRK